MLAIARCLLMRADADHARRADRRHHAEARRPRSGTRSPTIARRGIAVLLVEQNLRTALRLANRIYLMETRRQSCTKATADSAASRVPTSFTATSACRSNPRKEFDQHDEASSIMQPRTAQASIAAAS